MDIDPAALRNPDQLRGRDRCAALYAKRGPFSAPIQGPFSTPINKNPRSARTKAVAAPLPRLAPVINATRRIIDYLRLGPRDNEIEHRTPFDGMVPTRREASN
jgi:hypothetical protein